MTEANPSDPLRAACLTGLQHLATLLSAIVHRDAPQEAACPHSLHATSDGQEDGGTTPPKSHHHPNGATATSSTPSHPLPTIGLACGNAVAAPPSSVCIPLVPPEDRDSLKDVVEGEKAVVRHLVHLLCHVLMPLRGGGSRTPGKERPEEANALRNECAPSSSSSSSLGTLPTDASPSTRYLIGSAALLSAWLLEDAHVDLSVDEEAARFRACGRLAEADPSNWWWTPPTLSKGPKGQGTTTPPPVWRRRMNGGDGAQGAGLFAWVYRVLCAAVPPWGEQTLPPLPPPRGENDAAPSVMLLRWHDWLWDTVTPARGDAAPPPPPPPTPTPPPTAPSCGGDSIHLLHDYLQQVFQLAATSSPASGGATVYLMRPVCIPAEALSQVVEAKGILCYEAAMTTALSAVHTILHAHPLAGTPTGSSTTTTGNQGESTSTKTPSSAFSAATHEERCTLLRSVYVRRCPEMFALLLCASQAFRIAASQWQSAVAEAYLAKRVRPALWGCRGGGSGEVGEERGVGRSSSSPPRSPPPVHTATEEANAADTPSLARRPAGPPSLLDVHPRVELFLPPTPFFSLPHGKGGVVAVGPIAQGEVLSREWPLVSWERAQIAASFFRAASESPIPSAEKEDATPAPSSSSSPSPALYHSPQAALADQLLQLIRQAETALCIQLTQGTLYQRPPPPPLPPDASRSGRGGRRTVCTGGIDEGGGWPHRRPLCPPLPLAMDRPVLAPFDVSFRRGRRRWWAARVERKRVLVPTGGAGDGSSAGGGAVLSRPAGSRG